MFVSWKEGSGSRCYFKNRPKPRKLERFPFIFSQRRGKPRAFLPLFLAFSRAMTRHQIVINFISLLRFPFHFIAATMILFDRDFSSQRPRYRAMCRSMILFDLRCVLTKRTNRFLLSFEQIFQCCNRIRRKL